MATSILSSVGSALAGPGGSVIGGFLGRQFDRHIFGHGSTVNISDLRIPSARYGAEIPHLFGKMRVAGTIVWASDAVEGLRVSKNGSQPSRSVSFALAVSCSHVSSVNRMWADGRLIRGAAGDHKIPFTFRLLSGSEDQQCDPLIASFEGMNDTPAYRGVSIIVFEDLDLGTFGNRIPQINLEVEAGEDEVRVSGLLASKRVTPDKERLEEESFSGFAIQGSSVLEAISPLLSLFKVRFHYERSSWNYGAGSTIHKMDVRQYGLPIKGVERDEQLVDLPTQFIVRYFDEALDYGLGEQSSGSRGPPVNQRIDFPGTLTSHRAKSLAEANLSAIWREERSQTISLPLSAAAEVTVGDAVSLGTDTLEYRVEQKVIRLDHVDLTLTPKPANASVLQGDAGGLARERDELATELKIAIFELPAELNEGRPAIAVAVAGGAAAYRPMLIDVSAGGAVRQIASAPRAAIIGALVQPLMSGPPDILDLVNNIDVQLHGDEWLYSVDDADLLAGANLVFVGGEVLQFGAANALGGGRYRLSRLLRARLSSTMAAEAATGTSLVFFDQAAVACLPASPEMIGSPVEAGIRTSISESVTSKCDYRGHSLLPPAPINLAFEESESGFLLSWVRRSRQGAAWLDHVDAPLGEGHEMYRVVLAGSSGFQIELTANNPQMLIGPEHLERLGVKPWTVAVRQVGDFGISAETLLQIGEEHQ